MRLDYMICFPQIASWITYDKYHIHTHLARKNHSDGILSGSSKACLREWTRYCIVYEQPSGFLFTPLWASFSFYLLCMDSACKHKLPCLYCTELEGPLKHWTWMFMYFCMLCFLCWKWAFPDVCLCYLQDLAQMVLLIMLSVLSTIISLLPLQRLSLFHLRYL